LNKVYRGHIVSFHQEAYPKIEYQWSRLIGGSEGAQNLNLLEQATIETTIFPKGHVVIDSELWGEKRCGLKPPLATLQE
jgi:hypothetical protein